MFSAPHPRFRIYTSFNSYWSFFRDLILGRIKKGDDIEKLEQALAEKFNVSYAVCVSMARMGVYFSFKYLIKPGQEVIMSPYTIADVVNMVILAGGKPVFCDVGENTCNINPDGIESLINSNTGAIFITHLHGIDASIDQVLRICQKYSIPLVEDAAQAFGAYHNGKRLGTFGRAGVYSFGTFKNINAWYGGVIASDDKDLIDRIRTELNQYQYQKTSFIFKRILKSFLKDFLTYPLLFKSMVYWVFRYGFLHDIKWINRLVEIELDTDLKKALPPHYLARLTPFQARLAYSQLNWIESGNKMRAQKAALYHEGLKDIPGLIIPPKGDDYIYTVFPIQYHNRKKLLKWLMYYKRDVAAQHVKNCADLPSFSDFYRDCPVARKTANEVIILPTYPRYPISEVKKNIKVIREYFKLPPSSFQNNFNGS